jgi:hypothetical protein
MQEALKTPFIADLQSLPLNFAKYELLHVNMATPLRDS